MKYLLFQQKKHFYYYNNYNIIYMITTGKHHKSELKVFTDEFAKRLLDEYVNVVKESDSKRLEKEVEKIESLQQQLKTISVFDKSNLTKLNELIQEKTEDWAFGN